MEAREAYELLTTLERRLEGDRLEDVAEGQHRVTWPFLTNEYVIPRLRETGRISAEEAERLERVRRRARQAPEPDEEDVDVYPDVYELLLTLHPVMGIDDQLTYRGQRDHRWLLVPTLFRGAPDPGELSDRLARTFGFIERMAALGPEYRRRAEGDQPAGFLELVAVAQHYGCPTHLLDFTDDFRTAAFFATLDAPAGAVGEIVVLRQYQYQRYADAEGSPYGVRVTGSAPNPRIERQRGLFIAGFVTGVLHDEALSFLDRIRFCQDGRPFPEAGGYGREHVLDPGGTADGLSGAVLASTAGAVSPSPALARHFQRYREEVERLAQPAADSTTDEEYARACAWLLRKALPAEAEWIDVRVARLFAHVQIDLRKAPVSRRHLQHALRAQMAMESYLRAGGSLEERLMSAMTLAWGLRSEPRTDDDRLVSAIVDRHLDDFERDVNAR